MGWVLVLIQSVRVIVYCYDQFHVQGQSFSYRIIIIVKPKEKNVCMCSYVAFPKSVDLSLSLYISIHSFICL